MKIKEIKILPVNLPLENRFRTTLGEKTVTKNVWVILKCDGGIEGYGEASSSLAMPEATQKSMTQVLTKASQLLKNASMSDWREISETLSVKFPGHPTAISALECALLDAHCRSMNTPLFKYFGDKQIKIETAYTIPALKPSVCEKIIVKMVRKGFKKFKIKITGENPGEDIERIRLIKKYLTPSCSPFLKDEPLSASLRGLLRLSVSPPVNLRRKTGGGISVLLDANQGWKKETALKMIEKISSLNLSVKLIEQPLPKNDLKGLKILKKYSPVPVAVDESLRNLEDAKKIVEEDAADIFNIKIAKIGLLESIKIAGYLKKMKKRLMIGCMMESAFGLASSIHWACGSGHFDFVDLDSFLLLKPLKIETGFFSEGSQISVRSNIKGSGTKIDLDSIPNILR